MAITNSKDWVDNMISNNGYYNGDDDNSLGDNPRCVKIVEYRNNWNTICWGAVFEDEVDKFKYDLETEYIHDPKVIWEFES